LLNLFLVDKPNDLSLEEKLNVFNETFIVNLVKKALQNTSKDYLLPKVVDLFLIFNLKIGAKSIFPKESLIKLIDKYLFAGENAIPTQGASGQNCLQTELYAHVNLKKIQLHQELAYQTFSNNLKQSVQLPSLMSKSSVYFQSYAFKKSGFFQIGFDANISSSYKASIYNPATLQWQISEYKVGAYPFLDFFINAEVKTARIFFKMEHINMDLPNTRYYDNYLFVSPFHPASPRRFRLGFVWKFYY
jgi:hypothetical protein